MDQNNKSDIFKEWVNQYYEYGFRVAFRIIGNEEDGRDIVQDAFLKVWLRFESYNTKVKFTTWLFTIVTNLCIDRLRKKRTAAKYEDSMPVKTNYEEVFVENKMDGEEIRSVVFKLSENLSPKQKIVFVLRDMEDLEMDEVCAITKMPAEQVKANLYHARKAIRTNLVYLKIREEKL
jgi:RNA polymerase sigma-70 factor (ECF subfamily)